uniref:macrophage mannose receptor 1-like n=1 Tax=Centroberyx gerrardi TaxID=166262 RepID=UPI003AAC98D7
MKKIAVKLLLLAGLCEVALCVFGRHIYVDQKKTWSEAREYCREEYTDLSRIHSQEEDQELFKIEKRFATVWIGLYRDDNDIWKWSGGGNASFLSPLEHKSVNKSDRCVVHTTTGWHAMSCVSKRHFFCFESSLFLVKENKTWEEAMEHCRRQHTDLPSLRSDSALAQALNASRKAQTDRVWTGLRFLAGCWLWVNGDAVEHESWCRREAPHCPAWTLHCGVLSLKGQHWENWDCGDKLNFICY